MQSKSLSRRILLIITTLTGLALFAVLLFYFLPKDSSQSDSVPPIKSVVVSPKQKQPSFGLPTRLKIPVINIDAAVEYVGTNSTGAMNVPKDPANVAWFKLGQRPGEKGSAVIAGHYGRWKKGEGSVFDELYKLRKGDKLYVEDEKGVNISFVVRESRRYNPNANASEVFTSNDGKSHLNLITCESWDKVSESYSKRLVVFTDKK